MGKSFRNDNKHDNFRKYKRGKMKSHEAKKEERKKEGEQVTTNEWRYGVVRLEDAHHDYMDSYDE
jgi:hypothetical protein